MKLIEHARGAVDVFSDLVLSVTGLERFFIGLARALLLVRKVGSRAILSHFQKHVVVLNVVIVHIGRRDSIHEAISILPYLLLLSQGHRVVR